MSGALRAGLLSLLLSTVARTASARDCREYQSQFETGRSTELSNLEGAEPENPCRDYVLGLYYKLHRQFDRAFTHFQRAVESNPDYHGAHRELGWLCDGFRRTDEAREHYRKAIQLARQSADLAGEAEALLDLSSLERVAGNLDKALAQLHEAQSLGMRIGRVDFEATALLRMADVLVMLGELPQAEAKARQALDIRRALGDPRLWSAFNTLGDLYLEMAETASEPDGADAASGKAIANYQEARNAARHWDQKQMLSVNLADAHRIRGHDDAALGLYQAFLSDSPQAPSLRASHISALGGRGLVYAGHGLFDRALADLESAVQLAKADKRKRLELYWRKQICDLEAQRKRDEEARVCYDEILREARDGFLELGSSAERYAFFGEQSSVYEALVHLLLQMARRHPEGGYAREAFDYVERARAQSVLQALFESHLVERWLSSPSDAEAQGSLAALQGEADRLWKDRVEKRAQLAAPTGMDSKLREALQNEIEATESQLRDVYKKIVRLVEARLALSNVSNLAARLQQGRLKDGETLIEYMVADDETFVFVIDRDHLEHQVLPIGRKGARARGEQPGRVSLSQALGQVSPLFSPDSERPAASRSIAARDADIRLKALRTLYEKLFQPLEKHIESGCALVIVPDGQLYHLPFEMLLRAFDGAQPPRYLLADHAISYAYSARTLLEVEGRVDSSIGKALLVANPALGAASPPALPYSEMEIRQIRHWVKSAVVLTGREATELAFKREAVDAGLIHLATHATFDRRNYLDSSILFAPGQGGSAPEDGILYVHEVMKLNLSANLLVMTGCETGLGSWRPGSGLEGISRAFLTAGVRSVIGTLWPVADSDATARLTSVLYRNLASGMDGRTALQKAKLELLESGAYADPFYWAPFILVGNPGPVHLQSRFQVASLTRIAVASVLVGLLYWAYRRRWH